MKNILVPFTLILALAVICGSFWMPELSATPVPGGDDGVFEIDPMHSSILFRVKHLKASNFYGRFNEMSGSFRVEKEDLSKSFIKIKVPTASVDTNNANRDKHLKSQDFFSAKEFPTLSFESTKVEKAGSGKYKVTGDLTFRGVTESITFEAEHTGTAEVSDRFGLRSGYEAMVDIKRSDFGDQYGVKNDVLSDDVRLIVSLEGTPAK